MGRTTIIDLVNMRAELEALKVRVRNRLATPEERLRLKEIKLALMQAQVAKERTKLKETQRRLETRRKIILGAFLLHHLGKDPYLANYVRRKLRGFVNQSDAKIVKDILEA